MYRGAFKRAALKYMPLSFQGFGPMTIIAMVLILSVAQGINYLRARHRHH